MLKILEEIFNNALLKLEYIKQPIKLSFDKPKHEQFGDFSSNVSLLLSKQLKIKPREIAEKILDVLLTDNKLFLKVEIAGPGFINLYLNDDYFLDHLNLILDEKNHYGKSDTGKGRRVQIEFVSANPTGLLHLGHGRQAAIGDVISNLYSCIGYEVTREYYFNNAGRQMKLLADSVYSRYRQINEPQFPFPEDGYFGEYIKDIANDIYRIDGDKYISEQNITFFKEYAEQYLFEEIKKTLDKIGVKFDVFFNEDSLYKNKQIDEVVSLLSEKGLVFKKDGAVWFAADKIDTNLEPKVIIKSTGEPTYRLPDIAYHRDKFLRGFDLIIDIFGADHVATYPDVIAGIKALGFSVDKMKVLIHQFVTLLKDGEIVKMSKRNADMISLDELIDEVGKDAVRFFLVNRNISSHLEFDINLAKEQSDKNPVYYLQYAFARISSIIRFAESEGYSLSDRTDLTLIKEKAEIELVKTMTQFPSVVESAAFTFEPHRVTNYLYDLATSFHKFYHDHRVVNDSKDLTQSRLALCKATKIILLSGFELLGISAPERM